MRRTLISFTAAAAIAVAALVGPATVASAEKPARTTIVSKALEVNAATGEFSLLIQAVLAADLDAALSAKGQRTVFAPTDQAFLDAGIDSETIESLASTDEGKAALTDILLYHVTQGRKYAADVLSSSSYRMLNGDRAVIDGATIDGAPIVVSMTDIETDNGVIHVIGGVMIP